MSTSERLRRRMHGDRGFSLVEIVIAMGLLSVVLLAAIPMLLSMLGSTVVTRMNTQAKNLSQQRLEQLRDLRFHVDHQNGPFLDLLDLYYTNANAAGTPTNVVAGAVTLTGRYYSTGISRGVSAPFYEVTTGPLPGAEDFSQTIFAQFLGVDGSVLDKARYENVYDSQDPTDQGRDAPPSLSVRFIVITDWVQRGEAKEYRTTTVITDGRPELPLIQSQAKAIAVSVSSTAADATTLQLQGGLANLDGAQSSGSSVAGFVTGALATRTGLPAVSGQAKQFSLPGQGVTSSGSSGAQSAASGCSWYGFGPNGVTNVDGDVPAGLPKAPINVDDAGGPKVVTGSINQGTSNSCGLLSFDNLVGGGTPLDTTTSVLAQHMGAAPYVRVPDSSGSGGGLSGSGYLTATPVTASPLQTRSGARVAMAQPAVLFPNNTASGSQGLVRARLSSGQVDCVSGVSGAAGTVTGSYTLILEWWGKATSDTAARWHTRTYTYDSTATTPLTETGDAWEPATTLLDATTTLDQVVQVTVPDATNGVVVTGTTTGLRGFQNGVITLTTASTLSNEPQPGFSAIKVQLGQLSCVADDAR